MSPAVALLVEHGHAVLFGYVLASQLGAPLPSPPLLVAAGALAATGRLGMGQALAHVYPLEGGLDAWQRAGYPVDVTSLHSREIR